MRALVLAATLLCGGCSTFSLGRVPLPEGKTVEQRDSAMGFCREEARLQANSGEMQAAYFALGFTLVGYPAAIDMERRLQRTAFARCMGERGFAVNQPAT